MVQRPLQKSGSGIPHKITTERAPSAKAPREGLDNSLRWDAHPRGFDMVPLAASADIAAGSQEGPKSVPHLRMLTRPPDLLNLPTDPLVQSHSLCPRFPKVQPALLRLGSSNSAYFTH